MENDTILRLAGQQPYDPATEKRCRPLVDASEAELTALLAAHQLRKAEALSNQVLLVAKQQPRFLQSRSQDVGTAATRMSGTEGPQTLLPLAEDTTLRYGTRLLTP